MNDAPPPLTPSSPQSPYQQPQYQAPPKSGSGGKWALGCGLGCFALLIVAAIVGYFAFSSFKKMASGVVEGYTAIEAAEIEVPQVPQDLVDGAAAKFNAFKSGVEGGTPVPLELTGDEINALIFNHPNFKALAGKANVSIDGNVLSSRVSVNLDDLEIPVKFLADAAKGRYFNGEASFTLGMAVGRPVLYIEGLAVNGNKIPDEFLQELRKKNLFEEAGDSPEMKAALEKIEDMRIENGQLIIVPKAAP